MKKKVYLVIETNDEYPKPSTYAFTDEEKAKAKGVELIKETFDCFEYEEDEEDEIGQTLEDVLGKWEKDKSVTMVGCYTDTVTLLETEVEL